MGKNSNKVELIFVELLQQNSVSFCSPHKIEWNLEGLLRQKSINFCQHFRKINQPAKISAQQCCHTAMVFVTLSHTYANSAIRKTNHNIFNLPHMVWAPVLKNWTPVITEKVSLTGKGINTHTHTHTCTYTHKHLLPAWK